VVVDRSGDLVLANKAFHVLTDGVSERLLTAPINIPRLLLDPAGLAPRILNFARWSWHVIDALTREAAQNPSPGSVALIHELTALVPPRPAPDELGLAVPLHLRSLHGDLHLITTLTRFGTAIDVTVSELRMEAFLPADEPTATALRRLDSTMLQPVEV
jgi:hypothetical protein